MVIAEHIKSNTKNMANFLRKLFVLNDETTISRGGGLPAGFVMARQRAEQNGDTEAVQAIDNGTYKELLEWRASDRESKIAPGIEIYQYSIAGINYRKGIAAYLGLSTGYIKPEPTNRHDPNAIAVYAEDGHHLGYIPATGTYEVHSMRLRFPIPVTVDIEECYDADDRRFYVGEVTFHAQTKTGKMTAGGNKSVTF